MTVVMALIRLSLLVALLSAAQSLQQSKNPLTDFCRRWGHQTAQIDGKLYIDGGLVAWNPLSSNPGNSTNTWLLYSDLNSSTQDVGMPNQYANLTKNTIVPSVSGGILWADEINKCFYLYGGEYRDDPSDFALWTYDTVLNQWNKTTYSTNVDAIRRVSYGAGTQANELGYGYYYGGWLSNKSLPGWDGPPIATSNLIRYDYTTGFLRNDTGPDGIGRAEGSLLYLPASDIGLLVYFGGVESLNRNGNFTGANMSVIHIFDISSSKWYTQTASGSIPPARRQFCTGVTWADDHSSYNIYLYGGFGPDLQNTTAFDDSYILSIPSFTWIKTWPTNNSTTVFGHGGCSADVINRDQMLIIGGWFPKSQDCDAPDARGQHNMNLGFNGPRNTLWDRYDPKISAYFVPTPVLSAIGGGPTGGATATKPSAWDNADLAVYFTQIATFAARSATRSIVSSTAGPLRPGSSRESNVGAIAGGVVGGLVGVIALLLVILFCLRRRKKAQKARLGQEGNPSPPPAELAATSPLQEMPSPGMTKYLSMQHFERSQNTAFTGTNSMHSRSPSDHAQQHSPYPTHAYHSISSTAAATVPSPYSTHTPTHYDYQHSHTHQPYSDFPNTYDNQQSSYDSSAYPRPEAAQCHARYSYPTPISPSIPLSPPPQQQQVYYPPPPDPSARHLDGIQYVSGNEPQIPPSTSQTPAHFYAQPGISSRPSHQDEERLNPVGYNGNGSGSRGLGNGDASSSRGSIDSRRRPIRGRFVEVDHM